MQGGCAPRESTYDIVFSACCGLLISRNRQGCFAPCGQTKARKPEGVQKYSWVIKSSMEDWGADLSPCNSRPLIFPLKEAVLSPCNFATTHWTASILSFYLPCTSRPMKWRTLAQRPRKKSRSAQPEQFGSLGALQILGARLRGRTATQHSKKGS